MARGDDMKRVALLIMVMTMLTSLALSQQNSAPAPLPQAPSAAKLPPQAKSQDEYKAYQDAFQLQDPVAVETAANNFADKFKNSELRYLLYYKAMFGYQAQNNADKAIEMGRKVLALNPNEPVTLALVAAMLSERTRETDLDRDERLNEAIQDAQKSLEKIDSDLVLPPGTPQDRAEQNKKMIRSTAYGAIGNIYLTRNSYPEAEKYLKQAIDLMPESPDAVTVLRYAIALDQQKKYSNALTAANKALELSPPGSPQANMAKQEQERLSKLTGVAAQPQMAPPAQTAPPSR
jgi:tetratricopeptide (TPR) repeat protein